MTNPKNDPQPRTETINPTDKGATHHETGRPNSKESEGQSRKVQSDN